MIGPTDFTCMTRVGTQNYTLLFKVAIALAVTLHGQWLTPTSPGMLRDAT